MLGFWSEMHLSVTGSSKNRICQPYPVSERWRLGAVFLQISYEDDFKRRLQAERYRFSFTFSLKMTHVAFCSGVLRRGTPCLQVSELSITCRRLAFCSGQPSPLPM